MKKILLILIVASITCFVGYLSYGIYLKMREKNEVIARVASIPSFNFISLKREKITERNSRGTPLWLIFFHSDCEYCQMEAENVQKAGKLYNIQIWMASPESSDALSAFGKKYHLNNLSHVQLLNDTHHAGYHAFNVTSSPASFLYGPGGALIRQYKGVVKIETVLKDLKEASD